MNTLSFNRIKYLFSKYFIENWKKDITNFLILFIISGFAGYNLNNTSSIANFVLVIMILVYASSTFGMLSYKPKAMNYMLIPASSQEKLIVNIILVNIYYLGVLYISYIAGFFAGNSIYVLMHSGGYSLLPFKEYASIDYNVILGLLLIQSIFIFGSVYFKRKAFLKTILAIFCFGLFIAFIDGGLVYFLTENHSMTITTNQYYMDGTSTGMKRFIDEYGQILQIVWSIIFTLYFWVMSFIRFRETEV